MEHSLPQALADQARECKRVGCCLNSETPPACPVDFIVQDCIVFVKKTLDNYCKHVMSFGYEHVCNCPVRAELYKKYRV